MKMEYKEWFKQYETELNKEFADKNVQEFNRFCHWEFERYRA